LLSVGHGLGDATEAGRGLLRAADELPSQELPYDPSPPPGREFEVSAKADEGLGWRYGRAGDDLVIDDPQREMHVEHHSVRGRIDLENVEDHGEPRDPRPRQEFDALPRDDPAGAKPSEARRGTSARWPPGL
jgi:hypothetical protein